VASPRRPAGRSGAATLEACLEEARGGAPSPVYLLDGDPFLAGRAARELCAALVPEARRALNLVELDAAASPGEIAAELATGGLFGGGKVVRVDEPAFLAAREDAARAFAEARELWRKDRHREAARRLLALAAKAGWTAKDLAEGDADADAWERKLGVEGADEAFVAAAARWAIEREMKAARDDSGALEALLAAGLPPGRVLVVVAGKLDGKLPLVKQLAAAGRRVGFGVERAGAWNDERLVLGPVLEALLAGTGKRVDRAAEARLAELVGDDTRALAAELAKLAAFAGDRKVIGVEDVDALVTRTASDPFFALGNAVEARDLPAALAVLDRSLADGASPHMIVGSLAAAVRRMLLQVEQARAIVGDRAIRTPRDFEALVYPNLPEEDRTDRSGKPRHPFGLWKKYEAAQRYARGELLAALAGLAEADRGMKSGGDGRLLLERCLWKTLSRPEPPAGPAAGRTARPAPRPRTRSEE
jgi:DNA polymerase-3 subunit delta